MGVTRCLIFISLFSPIQGSELNLNILLIMELEELRDALKIASAHEYALIEELLVCVDKKSLIKQIRQTEKNDTPARVEYYGNPKAVTRMLVKLIEQGKLRYNGEDNYSRIIRSLTSVVDVVNESTGKIMSGESLVSYVKWIRAGELPEE